MNRVIIQEGEFLHEARPCDVCKGRHHQSFRFTYREEDENQERLTVFCPFPEEFIDFIIFKRGRFYSIDSFTRKMRVWLCLNCGIYIYNTLSFDFKKDNLLIYKEEKRGALAEKMVWFINPPTPPTKSARSIK